MTGNCFVSSLATFVSPCPLSMPVYGWSTVRVITSAGYFLQTVFRMVILENSLTFLQYGKAPVWNRERVEGFRRENPKFNNEIQQRDSLSSTVWPQYLTRRVTRILAFSGRRRAVKGHLKAFQMSWKLILEQCLLSRSYHHLPRTIHLATTRLSIVRQRQ